MSLRTSTTTASVALVAALSLAGALPAGAQTAQPLYRWVQYVPGGVEARAVTMASVCPEALIDDRPVAMKTRAAPGPEYPVRVCALPIPAGSTSAAIAGARLPLPKQNPDRVMLLGDTGCRVTLLVNQSCNSPAEWPFQSGQNEKLAQKPDVIIHVGDFHYRESGCRIFNRGCAGSPHGDSWAVWEADFFKPAKPLLEAAPFVFVRGNHEECSRGGKGWARTLDPWPFVSPAGCLRHGAPFVADLGSPKLVVMDVATADEGHANPRQVEQFRKEFSGIAALAPSGPVWVTMHRPIRAAGVAVLGFVIGDNKTLAAAARGTMPANVQMLLSGHIHTFQALGYQSDLPAQIVSGHGGDELHTTAPSTVAGLTINGEKVASGLGVPGVFGFAMLERKGVDWLLTDHDMAGKPLATCLIRGRTLACD